MMDFLRYVGAILVLVFAFFISRSYVSYLKRRVRECEDFCRLAEKIESMIRCYLSPIKEIFSGFECSEGVVRDFVKAVSEGATPREAYLSKEGELAIGKEGKKILSGLFSSLGHGYRDGSLELVRGARAELEKYTAKEREEGEKNSRLASALAIGGALGVVLLFI
ncbi:MAG: stage III sporulation protein AB [Clostridia bacterium]|nr:stage III sporulation protein AB [Clostridia bacterium]